MVLAGFQRLAEFLIRVIARIVVGIIVETHRRSSELFAYIRFRRASSAGQHPLNLNCVGIVLADATATADPLLRLLTRLIVDLKEEGTRRIILHDTFETLGADCGSSLAAFRKQGLDIVYSTPLLALRAWERVWSKPALHIEASKAAQGIATAASATHKDFVSKQLVSVLGADAADGPALLLVIGPMLCPAGFPPWHLRFCEIRHLGPARKATAHLHGALRHFQDSLLRFGT
jgi:hypothetical protein